MSLVQQFDLPDAPKAYDATRWNQILLQIEQDLGQISANFGTGVASFATLLNGVVTVPATNRLDFDLEFGVAPNGSNPNQAEVGLALVQPNAHTWSALQTFSSVDITGQVILSDTIDGVLEFDGDNANGNTTWVYATRGLGGEATFRLQRNGILMTNEVQLWSADVNGAGGSVVTVTMGLGNDGGFLGLNASGPGSDEMIRLNFAGSARITWDSTNAATNSGKWRLWSGTAGEFVLDALNDAENAATTIMEVTRSGLTINSVQFPGPVVVGADLFGGSATPNLRVNNIVTAMGTSQAYFQAYISGGGTDQKYWDVFHQTGGILYRAVNDAYSAATNWMTITRGSGYTIASVAFPNSPVIVGTDPGGSNLFRIGGDITVPNGDGMFSVGGAFVGFGTSGNSPKVAPSTSAGAAMFIVANSSLVNQIIVDANGTLVVQTDPGGTAVARFGGDITVGSLDTFDSSGTRYDGSSGGPRLGDVLSFNAKWEPRFLQVSVSTGVLTANANGDGTFSTFANDGRTLSGTSIAGPTPIVTPIYGGFIVNMGSVPPAGFVWEIEWTNSFNSNTGGPIEITSQEFVFQFFSNNSSVPFGTIATTFQFKVSQTGSTAPVYGTASTAQAASTNTEVNAYGLIVASQIACVNLAAISADLGIVGAGVISNAIPTASQTTGIFIKSTAFETSIPSGWTSGIFFAGANPPPANAWTYYLDFTATGTNHFLYHNSLTLNANGSATFGGLVEIIGNQVTFGFGGAWIDLRDTGLAHGMTGQVPTNVFMALYEVGSGTGGFGVKGFSTNDVGILLAPTPTTPSTGAVGANSSGALFIVPQKKNGTGIQALAAGDNAFAIGNGGSVTEFLVRGNGDTYCNGLFQAGTTVTALGYVQFVPGTSVSTNLIKAPGIIFWNQAGASTTSSSLTYFQMGTIKANTVLATSINGIRITLWGEVPFNTTTNYVVTVAIGTSSSKVSYTIFSLVTTANAPFAAVLILGNGLNPGSFTLTGWYSNGTGIVPFGSAHTTVSLPAWSSDQNVYVGLSSDGANTVYVDQMICEYLSQ